MMAMIYVLISICCHQMLHANDGYILRIVRQLSLRCRHIVKLCHYSTIDVSARVCASSIIHHHIYLYCPELLMMAAAITVL